MKRHLILFIDSEDNDFHTFTYCGMDSHKWSEHFEENREIYLVDYPESCTCKLCLKLYDKQFLKYEKMQP